MGLIGSAIGRRLYKEETDALQLPDPYRAMPQASLLRSSTSLCRLLTTSATKWLARDFNGRSPAGGVLLHVSRPLGTTTNVVNVTVTPQHAHMDEAGHIQVEGLSAGEAITLWTTVFDDKGIEFSSHAHYKADPSGWVDVWRHKALGGRYEGIFPQGPVTAMATAPPVYRDDIKLKFARLYKRKVEEPFTYQIRVVKGHLTEEELYGSSSPETLASVYFTRHLMGAGVTRREVEHSRIRGTLFLPPGKGPHPLVLDMFGNHRGNYEFRSSMLATKGYASLSLPYFGYKDLPKVLTSLDMDYFLEGLDYLRGVPGGNPGRVGVFGSSKGAEIAILMAGLSQEVKAVVGINPYNVSVDTDYFFGGKPYLNGFKISKKTVTFEAGEDGVMHLTGKDDFFQWDSQYTLPIERKSPDCQVLIVAGDQDGSLAHRSAMVLSERARRLKCENVHCLILPGAGHILDPPYHAFHESLWSTINVVKKGETSGYLPGMAQYYGGKAWWTPQGTVHMWNMARQVLHLKLVQEAGLPIDTAH